MLSNFDDMSMKCHYYFGDFSTNFLKHEKKRK